MTNAITSTRIRDTYFEATYGQAGQRVSIALLRSAHPGVSREAFDAALMELTHEGVAIYPEDNPRERTPELVAGAWDCNGYTKHWVRIEG